MHDQNKHFCIAPWVHVCQNVGGRLKPCCRFWDPEELQVDVNTSINDYFYSEAMDNFRNKMLKDEPIAGCGKCYKEDQNFKPSLRTSLNERYSTVDTNSNPTLKYLEIGISNACNFKCVTCASNYSTSWYEDDAELNSRGFFREHIKKNKFVTTKSDYLELDLSKLDRLKLLGGEPFMEPRNLLLLEKLDNLGRLENLDLELITNASIMPNEQWITYLKKIKKVNLSISLDGIEKVAEFVRYGTEWDKIEKNTTWWRDFCKQHDHHMQFHYVIHAFNCFDIANTMDWVSNNWTENNYYTLINFDCLFGPKYLNISYLPDWWKEDIRKNLEKIYRPANKSYAINFLSTNNFDPAVCRQMIDYYYHLEDIRKTSLPNLYKIYIEKLKKDL